VIPARGFDPHLAELISAKDFISNSDVPAYLGLADQRMAVFLNQWQDDAAYNKVTLKGLKDLDGRPKVSYYQLKAAWTKDRWMPEFPNIQILLPANTAMEGSELLYQAVVQKPGESNWNYIDPASEGIDLEWNLIKRDPVLQKTNPSSGFHKMRSAD